MSSNYLLSVQEALEDQQWSLTQAPFRLLLLPWVLEHVRLSVHPLGVESVSHSLLGLSEVSPTGLKAKEFCSLLFPVKDLWAGEPNVGLRPILPWGECLQL